MSNYKNIKPYADFAHKAAQNGGIEKYLEMLENTNREIGAMEERKTEGWKAVLVLSVGIILWEGGKAGIRGIKKIYIEHKTYGKCANRRNFGIHRFYQFSRVSSNKIIL